MQKAMEYLQRGFQANRRESLNEFEVKLIRRAQGGDQDAFTEIMNLYRERIIRMAYHMVGNMEDAGDLCQEVFVRVYRGLKTFDPRRPFAPWIYRIAHNVVKDHFRSKSIRPSIMESEMESSLEGWEDANAVEPLSELLPEETRREVREAIQSLPEGYRSVIVFRYLDDLSYAEIAQTLGLTEANVMMRMTRARQMLRRKLYALDPNGAMPAGSCAGAG